MSVISAVGESPSFAREGDRSIRHYRHDTHISMKRNHQEISTGLEITAYDSFDEDLWCWQMSE